MVSSCGSVVWKVTQFRQFGVRNGLIAVQRRCLSYHNKKFSTETSPKATDTEEIDPLHHHNYFSVRELVTLDDLFKYNVHLGHTYGCRNKYMTPYLFGSRLGCDIIDLEQTMPLLQDALNFTAHIAYRDGIILFISRNKQMMPWIERTAKEVGEYAHCRYWKGGIFTDSTNIFGTMTRLPDLGIFLSTLNNAFTQHRGVIDHAKLLIPTIGICDSNADPRLITYPVPGNDDSRTAILYYLSLFKEAILRGKAKRKEDKQLSSSD